MSSLNVTLPSIMVSARRPQGKTEICDRGTGQVTKHCLGVPGLCSQPFQTCIPISQVHRLASSAMICAAALNARCGAEQTQTVTRQSSTITIAPVQGKEKSPELDDGGTGLPPRDDGDGGGGGGGGWGGWSGGFFFFGFLAFLGLLKDKENEGPYRDTRRR
ncbi:protein FERTILITY RESTORER RF2, mitochondrial-like [Aristolochia californica]|uniref:protein FERTILITY RESTORER RF2, mitochondrial-like n=1 Tax=Aristolochia californica TaxID=171875 RepID=UPI0035DC9C50